MHYRYLFGPVSSRRLGRSLGVDLVPLKTCNYDCVYCECGKTTNATNERHEFIPTEEVISELSHFLSSSPALDYITFAGSGEPTLSLSIGRVIRFLKDRFPEYRIAVLTNSSLLSDPAVRAALMPTDVVLPTFSTAINGAFQAMHRPVPGMDPAGILEGLLRFREEYRGEIWLEIFIIPGLNTSDLELAGLRDAINAIHPDRVQLNTLDRPGTDDRVRPASPNELAHIARILGFEKTQTIESTCYEGPGLR
jgi:wyosine [tRNA(Phe)-imidazoG37] synthetase (radical SAM superfamily)